MKKALFKKFERCVQCKLRKKLLSIIMEKRKKTNCCKSECCLNISVRSNACLGKLSCERRPSQRKGHLDEDNRPQFPGANLITMVLDVSTRSNAYFENLAAHAGQYKGSHDQYNRPICWSRSEWRGFWMSVQFQ
jgi:hypothetical protein